MIPRRSTPVSSVDVYGVPLGASGWTTVSLDFARALNELVPVALRSRPGALRRAILKNPGNGILWRGLTTSPAPFGVVVTGKPAAGQPTAGWVVWETTVLPEAVRNLCEATAFVWPPSSWGRRNLMANGVPAEKLTVVPQGVDIDFFHPGPTRARGPFRFVFVGKWETRKFIDGLARAFATEFSPSESVELVLHANNPYVPDFSPHAELAKFGLPPGTRISMSTESSRTELRQLYQSADCFVCPTRAEGFGLPILEAMACGVPAIVTRYSAPVDFVTDENGYLLDVERMVDAHCDFFNIHTGQWAEPSVPHLRALMRQAVDDSGLRKHKGEAALHDAQRWSWREVAKIALAAIHEHTASAAA